MKSTRPINKLFQEVDSDLAILITRTRLLRRLTHLLRKQLETELAAHCYVANIEQETLVILADTAARASKLRFYTATLLDTLPPLDNAFSRITRIKVKILNQAQKDDTPLPKRQGPKMNQENAVCIQTLADSVDDLGLHDALTRLARHAKPQD
jgi:hypothetical protein